MTLFTKDLTKLEKNLGIKFKNLDLLKQACVHRSYLNENPNFPLPHNERLEFLGDAVLEIIVTEHLYRNHPDPEGVLTNWRSAIVNTRMLAQKAKQLEIENYLYLSRGEVKSLGKAREVILANAFEACVGAIYLDQGMKKAKDFIEKKLLVELPQIIQKKLYVDPKSQLQELVQDKLRITPTYQVLKEWGPDHARQFLMGVYLEDKLIGQGQGRSKQEAQVKAAEDALKKEEWKKIRE